MSQPDTRHAVAAGYARGLGRLRRHASAAAAVAAATAVAWALAGSLASADLVMVYLLAVVAVAGWSGRGPSTLAVLLSVAAFNFFFVPPAYTFAVADTQYLLTFAVMLAVGLVISGLTARIQRQTEGARRGERDMAALAAMSQELAGAESPAGVGAIAQRHLGEVFAAHAVVLLRDVAGPAIPDTESGPALTEEDHRAIRRVLREGRRAGLGTPGEPGEATAYLPLPGKGGAALGVVCVRPASPAALSRPETLRLLETFVAQTALALERVRAARDARAVLIRAETERLRSTLLTSVSHDLRTSLAVIADGATALLRGGPPDDTRRELLESIRHEAEALHRLVQDRLDAGPEAGSLRLRREWHRFDKVVDAALGRLAKHLAGRPVEVHVAPDLPLVYIDDLLIEQVLTNLLENAARYTPDGSPVRIAATTSHNGIVVEVADRGPGLPPGDEDRIFDKLDRHTGGAAAAPGLGLVICRDIVEAHGGRMWAHTLPEGGSAFFFRLPPADPPSAP